MEVILKQDVEHLGFEKDLVTVKNGYGRNYLIPQGYAQLATPSAKKMREEMLKQQAYKEQKHIQEAKENASNLDGLELEIPARAGNSGKMFGSIGPADVSKALVDKDVEIDKKFITIQGGNIKRLGQYTAFLRFHREVIKEVIFDVVRQS